MKSKELNAQAMDLLTKGDFDSAQPLFYLNARENPCHQTYNNLGMFLYENGMQTRNGKYMSGAFIGEKYIKKALSYGQDEVILRNMGQILYEKEDYISANKFYRMAYALEPKEKVMYNIATSLFAMHKYAEAYECLQQIRTPLNEAISPLLFSLTFCDKQKMLAYFHTQQCKEQLIQMNLPNQMNLLYLCNQYEKVTDIAESVLSKWSLNDSEWAVLTDSFINTGKEDTITHIIKTYFEDCEMLWEKRQYRTAMSFLTDAQKRQKYIVDGFDTLCFPQIVSCGYYGCPLHGTAWKE